MVASLKMAEYEELLMFVHEVVPALAALEGSAHLVVDHLPVPVGQHVAGEPGAKLDNPKSKVGVVDVEVVRQAPHDYQVYVLLLQLPGDGAAGPGEAALLVIDRHHHLPVRGEHLALVKAMLEMSVLEVVDGVPEEPPGPVDNVDGTGGGVGAAGVGDGR